MSNLFANNNFNEVAQDIFEIQKYLDYETSVFITNLSLLENRVSDV